MINKSYDNWATLIFSVTQKYLAVCRLNVPLIRKLPQFEANNPLHNANRLYRSFKSFRNEKTKNSSVLTITRHAEECSLYTVQTDSCQGIGTIQ